MGAHRRTDPTRPVRRNGDAIPQNKVGAIAMPRFAAADPSGQEYIEFKGLPRHMDPDNVRVAWEQDEDRYAPRGTARAMIGGKEVARIEYYLHGDRKGSATIANVWCDPEARGWGIGKLLFENFREKMLQDPRVQKIYADIHTREALRSLLLTYGPPAYLGDDTDEYKPNAKGVGKAYEKLWKAADAYPDKDSDIRGPSIEADWDVLGSGPNKDWHEDDDGEESDGEMARFNNKWKNPKAIHRALRSHSTIATRADKLGFARIADDLDTSLLRVAQYQPPAVNATQQQMANFMAAVNQLSSLVAKHEHRLAQAEQNITKMQESAGAGGIQGEANTVHNGVNVSKNNGAVDITAPPGTNLNLTANSPNETNSEINL